VLIHIKLTLWFIRRLYCTYSSLGCTTAIQVCANKSGISANVTQVIVCCESTHTVRMVSARIYMQCSYIQAANVCSQPMNIHNALLVALLFDWATCCYAICCTLTTNLLFQTTATGIREWVCEHCYCAKTARPLCTYSSQCTHIQISLQHTHWSAGALTQWYYNTAAAIAEIAATVLLSQVASFVQVICVLAQTSVCVASGRRAHNYWLLWQVQLLTKPSVLLYSTSVTAITGMMFDICIL
jgi:hypothetical protein